MSSKKRDDRILDEYLQDGSVLSRAYKETTDEHPPGRLDAAILDEARRAVVDKPRVARSPFSRNWVIPVSLAAVLVLTVGLVTFMFEETRGPLAPKEATEPAFEPASDEEITGELREDKVEAARSARGLSSVRQAPAKRKRDRKEEPGVLVKDRPLMEGEAVPARPKAPAESSVGRMQAPEAAAPAMVPAGPPASKQQLAPAEQEPAPAARASQKARAKSAEGVAPARGLIEHEERARELDKLRQFRKEGKVDRLAPASLTATEKEGLSPEAWLRRIAELRKQGKHAEADASLAEFKKRYPDYPIEKWLKE